MFSHREMTMKDYWRAVICLPLLVLLGMHLVDLINDAEWGTLAVVAAVAVGGLLLARSRALEKYDASLRRRL